MPRKPVEAPKVPKTLGECADALYTLREERLALGRSVKAIEECEKLIKEHIISTLPKSNTTGVAGKIARVQTGKKLIPIVEDWTKFYAYVKKKNAFELLQRRLTETAITDRWDNGIVVPGVTQFNAVTVSVTKL